jgi:hypothetical protein
MMATNTSRAFALLRMITVYALAFFFVTVGAYCTRDHPIPMGVLTSACYAFVAHTLYSVRNTPEYPSMVKHLEELSRSFSCGSSYLEMFRNIALFVCMTLVKGACLMYNLMFLESLFGVLDRYI